jgi:hypothetical protein
MEEGMKPQRIQRKRVKGWRMPPNTVSVTRPGKWGNPFDVATYGMDLSLALFREVAAGCWNPSLLADKSDAFVSAAYNAHHAWLQRLGNHPVEFAHGELRGRNLACFCAEGSPCHADILLEIANR